MDFLPTDYTPPKNPGDYMKFQDGENTFRILSKPIIGWEDWADGKPVRYKHGQEPAKKTPTLKHFWAMIVWNYSTESIQILHLTQSGIRAAIKTHADNKRWGAPYFYDFVVMRSGEKPNVKYTLMALPGDETSKEVREAFINKPCYLDALYTGEKPFSLEHEVYTPGIFTRADLTHSALTDIEQEAVDAFVEDAITLEQLQVLEAHFAQDAEHKASLEAYYLKKKGIESFDKMNKADYELVLEAVQKRQKTKSKVKA